MKNVHGLPLQPDRRDARAVTAPATPTAAGAEPLADAYRSVLHGSHKLVAGSSLTRTIFAVAALSARTSTVTQRPTRSDALLAWLFCCHGLCVIHFRYIVWASVVTVRTSLPRTRMLSDGPVTLVTTPTSRPDSASADHPKTTSPSTTTPNVRDHMA